jgi:hypothetical protein
MEKINRVTFDSNNQAARIAGAAILIMALFAGFAYGYALKILVVTGDANVTANNIRNSEMLFRIIIFSFVVILICDVVVAWALYDFLKSVNEQLSLLGAWLRLVYASILGVALFGLVFILSLNNGAGYSNVFEEEHLNAYVLLCLNAFDGIWSIGLVIFGCHLLVVGYLAFRSGYIPQILGMLLIIAALSYLISNLANLLLPNYEDYKATTNLVLSVPMIVGELGFGLWLLVKGNKHSPSLRIHLSN